MSKRRMWKCRHDTALFYRWLHGVWVAFAAAPRAVAFDCARMTCVSCGEWLSLGPSADESPEVQVEMRAIEIAQHIADITASRSHFKTIEGRDVCFRHVADVLNGAEVAGYIIHNFDSAKQPEQDGEWAGYLAAAIAAHEETP